MADVPRAVVCPRDEVANHLLGVLEVRDHTVAQRSSRDDVGGGAAKHATGFTSDREHLARALAHRDNRRFIEHDAPSADVDQRVGGPEVDADVGGPDPQHGSQQVQDAWKSLGKWLGRGGSYTCLWGFTQAYPTCGVCGSASGAR